MNDTFSMSTGQAHELALALGRTGWNNAEVKKLSEGDLLAKVRLLVLGQAEVTVVKHMIDLAADPFIPDGFKGVEHHEKGAADFEWDPAKVRLHLSKNQEGTNSIEGNKLRTELASESPFNANLLDYLLKNPYLIPEEWKGKYVYFWGTIYRDSGGHLYVRYLYWDGSKWRWYCPWLDYHWNSNNPAACLAK